MKRIVLDQDIRSVSDFRAHTNTYIRQVNRTRRPIVLTQNGKSTAVLLNVSDYENMMDEIELVHDVRQARKEIKDGKFYNNEEAFSILNERFK